MINMDTHGNALGEPYPCESRVDRRQEVKAVTTLVIGDAARDALDMANHVLCIAHQAHPGLVANLDVTQFRLFEVRLNPD
jgi:hypothetical protein